MKRNPNMRVSSNRSLQFELVQNGVYLFLFLNTSQYRLLTTQMRRAYIENVNYSKMRRNSEKIILKHFYTKCSIRIYLCNFSNTLNSCKHFIPSKP